jgi:long-chain acyl-CoA synthetase
VASTNPYGNKSRLGTVGIPVPGTAMKVDDDGVEQPWASAASCASRARK